MTDTRNLLILGAVAQAFGVRVRRNGNHFYCHPIKGRPFVKCSTGYFMTPLLTRARGITCEHLYQLNQKGDSPKLLAQWYGMTANQVKAAIEFWEKAQEHGLVAFEKNLDRLEPTEAE